MVTNGGRSGENEMQSPPEQLFHALQASDIAAARAVLRDFPEAPNEKLPSGSSVLMTAIYMRASEFVSLILELGAPCDIWAAAALGDTRRLAEAIEADGAATTSLSYDGWTPLHLASHFGMDDACAMLIDAGADVNAWSANALQNQPLHAAVAGGSEKVVRKLLNAGANVNAVQHGGFTPLHGAAQHGAVEIVKRLLEHGAVVTATTDEGVDAAALAEMHGHVGVAEYLRSGHA